MDAALIALIGTACGGVGLKIVETILSRPERKRDDATEIREELRKELTDLREELRRVDHELDSWKEKYFLLLQEYLEIKSRTQHKDDGGDDW